MNRDRSWYWAITQLKSPAHAWIQASNELLGMFSPSHSIRMTNYLAFHILYGKWQSVQFHSKSHLFENNLRTSQRFRKQALSTNTYLLKLSHNPPRLTKVLSRDSRNDREFTHIPSSKSERFRCSPAGPKQQCQLRQISKRIGSEQPRCIRFSRNRNSRPWRQKFTVR